MTTSTDTDTLAGLREELRLIGCHQNCEARCTCAIGADALDAIDALRAQAAKDKARIERLQAALREAEETLRLVEHPAFPDPAHHQAVKALGLRIGFGALMSTASAAWRETLEADGYTSGGEYVAGPCFGTVASCLAKIRAALEDGE